MDCATGSRDDTRFSVAFNKPHHGCRRPPVEWPRPLFASRIGTPRAGRTLKGLTHSYWRSFWSAPAFSGAFGIRLHTQREQCCLPSVGPTLKPKAAAGTAALHDAAARSAHASKWRSFWSAPVFSGAFDAVVCPRARNKITPRLQFQSREGAAAAQGRWPGQAPKQVPFMPGASAKSIIQPILSIWHLLRNSK